MANRKATLAEASALLPEEDLQQVPDAPGYFVARSGRVYHVWEARNGWRTTRLKTMRHSGGYPQVQVGYTAGRRIRKVHKLVAAAFLPPPAPGQYLVRHKDDVPDNCAAENLAWGGQIENQADAKRNGRRTGRPPIYSADTVAAIRREKAAGERTVDVAKRHGVSPQLVSDIVAGRKRPLPRT